MPYVGDEANKSRIITQCVNQRIDNYLADTRVADVAGFKERIHRRFDIAPLRVDLCLLIQAIIAVALD